ncbi:MAG TPA: acyl-CoA reductase [Polyangiaceae bacterium]|jgi:hypothetical protein|nr:acyl-CoA reductase [Polyangiaceae bacterium]
MTAREEQVWALVAAARRLADAKTNEGARARAVLAAATGLSVEGVELALTEHLETEPTRNDVTALVGSVEPARAAHVVLSAGVFVAAHRAIALGLAASDTVFVKPSRREPEMARLLAEALPGSFTVVDAIAPRAGDVVFAYGNDETLAAMRAALPAGVRFRGHGTGFGVAIIDARGTDAELEASAVSLCRDVVPFDQRGCLSPRIVFVTGTPERGHAFSEALSHSLARAERLVPRGQLSADEAAEITRYRDTIRYAGALFPAGTGWIGFDATGGAAVLPPVGRNLHVVVTNDVPALLAPISKWITAIGMGGAVSGGTAEGLTNAVRTAVPRARMSALGLMQKPPFDGPVDRRDTD